MVSVIYAAKYGIAAATTSATRRKQNENTRRAR